MRGPVRVWTDDDGYGFTLLVFDAVVRDPSDGRRMAPYEFYHNGELIFSDTLGCSPMHPPESLETVAAILTFVGLRPGDTDDEYFDSYTPRQLEWCVSCSEHVTMCWLDLEELFGAADR